MVHPLIDESVDAPIVAQLRTDGRQGDYVAEMSAGVSDEVLLALANDRNALLLTADKDFGELVFRLRRAPGGLVLIRLPGLSPTLKSSLVAEAVRGHGEAMQQAFSVVAPGMVRIRPRS